MNARNHKPLIDEMKKMADIEEKYAIKLDKDFRGWGNQTVDNLIEAISFDSRKHAILYRTAAFLLEGKNLSLIDIEFEGLQKSIKEHIETEKQMIKKVKELLTEIDNLGVKNMLNMIYRDELNHHLFMVNLLELVLKSELITEEDLYNLLFRDSPTHGAPEPEFE
jgi:rubrerythrin